MPVKSKSKPKSTLLTVPFLGWSQAANRFRQLAAVHAKDGTSSALFIGQKGVGKRHLATIWQQVAEESGQDSIPAIDLSNPPTNLPSRCVGLTDWQLPPRTHCLDLGTGKNGLLPPSLNAKVLPPEIANQFLLKFYLPPLGQRSIDVLATLHFYNSHVLPTKFGCAYHSINSNLINSMLFKTEWSGNFRELIGYIQNTASRDANLLPASKYSAVVDLGTMHANPDLPFFHVGSPVKPDAEMFDGLEDIDIPFDQVPELAINLFRWQCMNLPINEEPQDLSPPIVSRLGIELFQDCEDRISQEDFCRMTVEEFVTDHLLLGLPTKIPNRLRSENELEYFCQKVKSHSVLGANFESMQAGLAIPQETLIDQYNYQETIRNQTEEVKGSKPSEYILTEKVVSALEKLQGQSNSQPESKTVNIQPKALSKDEAARYIGVERKTIDNLIRERKIKYVQVGKQRGQVIPIESLDRFLEENKKLTAQEELRKRKRR